MKIILRFLIQAILLMLVIYIFDLPVWAGCLAALISLLTLDEWLKYKL